MSDRGVVLVDDLRTFKPEIARSNEVTILRTAEEAVDWITKFRGTIAQLWLDHDLGMGAYGTPVTVIPFIRALVANKNVTIKTIVIHTSNVAAIGRIKRELEHFKEDSIVITVDASIYMTSPSVAADKAVE